MDAGCSAKLSVQNEDARGCQRLLLAIFLPHVYEILRRYELNANKQTLDALLVQVDKIQRERGSRACDLR